MKRIRATLWCFLCCFGLWLNGSVAQTAEQDSMLQLVQTAKNDSLKALHLIDLATSYKRSSWKMQHQYASQAYELLNGTDYKALIASALHALGSSYLRMDEPSDTALLYFKEGLELAQELGDAAQEANLHIGIGAFYQQTSVYDKSYESYQNALTIADQEDLVETRCRVLNNLALILMREEQYDKALTYFERALKTAEELENKLFISAILSNTGIVHNALGEYDLSLEKYTRSLAVRRENNDKIGEVLTICNIGNLHRQKDAYELALTYQQQGLRLAEEIDFIRGKTVCLEGLSLTHFDWERFEGTIKYAEQGLAISERNNFLENQVEFKDLLAKSFAALGSYETAYKVHTDYLLLHDSVKSLQRYRQVSELETKYQLRQKEAEYELIRDKQELQQDALQNRNILIGAVLALLVVTSLLAFNYYRTSRQKQRYNEQLQKAVDERTAELNESIEVLTNTNEELENFAFIASHDLKEPLRGIISFNNLIQNKLGGKITHEIKDYFSFVNTSGQQMYHLIESTLEFSRLTKTEGLTEWTDVNLIIQQATESLQELIQDRNAKVEVAELPTIYSNPDQLYLVFKNLIENGIKYNDDAIPEVHISHQQGMEHQFIIRDNGIGISSEYHDKVFQMFKRLHNKSEYPGSGLGLSIVHKTLQRLGGSVSLQSEAGQGSIFLVKIPVGKTEEVKQNIVAGE